MYYLTVYLKLSYKVMIWFVKQCVWVHHRLCKYDIFLLKSNKGIQVKLSHLLSFITTMGK